MKITNIDAHKHLARKAISLNIPQFVLDVIRPLERKMLQQMHYSIMKTEHFPRKSGSIQLPFYPIRKFEHFGYEQVSNLVHTIPIYLRDVRPDEYNKETDIVDALGAYFPNRRNYDPYDPYDPYIELYLSNIDNASGSNDLIFKWLFAKVLIHELAHAVMDIFNYEHCNQTIEKVQYCTEFGKWREESMANAVALRIIREYGNRDFYDYAKSFMCSQPAEYALGVRMEDFGHWDFRSVTDGKEDGVNADLQQKWLDYAKGNPSWDGLQCWNKVLCSKFAYFYQQNYYTGEAELVKTIVNDVLNDFAQSHGKKMSIAEFKAIFPYIKTGTEMSYEPSGNVQGDSRFDKIELEDGDLSLYYYWNNETMHEFVKNTGRQFDEYQNW